MSITNDDYGSSKTSLVIGRKKEKKKRKRAHKTPLYIKPSIIIRRREEEEEKEKRRRGIFFIPQTIFRVHIAFASRAHFVRLSACRFIWSSACLWFWNIYFRNTQKSILTLLSPGDFSTFLELIIYLPIYVHFYCMFRLCYLIIPKLRTSLFNKSSPSSTLPFLHVSLLLLLPRLPPTSLTFSESKSRLIHRRFSFLPSPLP